MSADRTAVAANCCVGSTLSKNQVRFYFMYDELSNVITDSGVILFFHNVKLLSTPSPTWQQFGNVWGNSLTYRLFKVLSDYFHSPAGGGCRWLVLLMVDAADGGCG